MKELQARIVNRLEQAITNLFVRAILYLTDGMLIAGSSLLAPIYAIFVERIGGGIIEAGTSITIHALTAGIGLLVFSRVEDRNRDFRHYVVIGYFLAAVGYLNLILFQNLPALFVSQFIWGVATAIRVPAYDVLLSQSARGHLAIAWGNWNSVAFLVSSAGAFLGAIIAATLGFQILLITMFALAFSALAVSLALLHRHHHKDFLPHAKRLIEETKETRPELESKEAPSS